MYKIVMLKVWSEKYILKSPLPVVTSYLFAKRKCNVNKQAMVMMLGGKDKKNTVYTVWHIFKNL